MIIVRNTASSNVQSTKRTKRIKIFILFGMPTNLACSTWTLDQLTSTYLNEIAHLHGVPNSIFSNRDTRFQAGFWQNLQEVFYTKLNFSTTFHAAIDGQTEHTT